VAGPLWLASIASKHQSGLTLFVRECAIVGDLLPIPKQKFHANNLTFILNRVLQRRD
jgi:hypothetical protein